MLCLLGKILFQTFLFYSPFIDEFNSMLVVNNDSLLDSLIKLKILNENL